MILQWYAWSWQNGGKIWCFTLLHLAIFGTFPTLRTFRRTKENYTPISCKIQLVFLIAKKIFDKNTLNYKLS